MTDAERNTDNARIASQLEGALRAVQNPNFDRRMALGHLTSAVEQACQVLRGTREAHIDEMNALFARFDQMGD
jgi:hypothetical protein